MNKELDSNCLGIQRWMRFSVLKEHFELVSDPAFSSVLETESSHTATGLPLRICLVMNHLQKSILEAKKNHQRPWSLGFQICSKQLK